MALVDVAEDIVAALGHQHPKVKEGTLSWLESCLGRESKAGTTKLLKSGVVAAVAKCTDEGAPTIREAAFSVLVACALKVTTTGESRCLVEPGCGGRACLHALRIEWLDNS